MLLKDTACCKDPFPSKESDTNLLQSIYFACEVGVISSYSNRICYKKIAKAAERMLESCMRLLEQCLRTIASNATLVSYDVTGLAIIKPNKHQRLADPLLQSGVVTRNNRVYYAVKSTRKSIWQNH